MEPSIGFIVQMNIQLSDRVVKNGHKMSTYYYKKYHFDKGHKIFPFFLHSKSVVDFPENSHYNMDFE